MNKENCCGVIKIGKQLRGEIRTKVIEFLNGYLETNKQQ